jgi:hypothetical protein
VPRFRATWAEIKVFNRIRELVFAHYAWTQDGYGLAGEDEEGLQKNQVKEAGSGILAAPLFGISAKHVSKGFERLSPELEALRRRQSPLDPQYRIDKRFVDMATTLYQVSESTDTKLWRVEVDWASPDTDITTFQVRPLSEATERIDPAKLPYFDWQLKPPKVGSIVSVYGWPGQELFIDPESNIHTGTLKLRVENARIIEICDPIQVHGLTEFPGFVIDRPLAHGFSGGPVLFGDNGTKNQRKGG